MRNRFLVKVAGNLAVMATLWLTHTALGQTTLPGPTTTDAPAPKNIDRMLEGMIAVDAEKMPLAEFVGKLRDQTQTNIFVNWNAVAQTGLARDTPVTLHLKDISYEHVVKTLMEILPAEKSRANYQVADNTLEITTNASLGKGTASRLYPVGRVVTYSLAGTGGAAGAAANERLIQDLLQAELIRAGEPMDAGGHAMAIRGGTLAAAVSERGQTVLQRAITMLNTPIRPGQFAPGTSITATAKRAQDALTKTIGAPSPATFLTLAKDPAKYAAALNIALFPGVDAELAKPTPAIGGTITDGGVILIGPADSLSRRTFFAAYDLREVIKRLTTKSTQRPAPPPADQQGIIVQTLKTRVLPVGGWGTGADLGKNASLMIPYEGLLLVFATADEHRTITAALQEMMK